MLARLTCLGHDRRQRLRLQNIRHASVFSPQAVLKSPEIYTATSPDAAPCLFQSRYTRHTQRHQDQPRPRVLWFVTQEYNRNPTRQHDIERRQHRVSKRPIRPHRVRLRPAQHKQTHNRQNVKNQHRKNHVIQQIPVAPAQAKQARPPPTAPKASSPAPQTSH